MVEEDGREKSPNIACMYKEAKLERVCSVLKTEGWSKSRERGRLHEFCFKILRVGEISQGWRDVSIKNFFFFFYSKTIVHVYVYWLLQVLFHGISTH